MNARTAHRLLASERGRLEAMLDGATASPQVAGVGTVVPGDSPDFGGHIVEREIAETVHAHAEWALREIDAARARIDDRTFGICETCGGRIGNERLQVRPAARNCVAHATAEARAGGRVAV